MPGECVGNQQVAAKAGDTTIACDADRALVQRCLAQNEQAWQALYLQCLPWCRAIVAQHDLTPQFEDFYAEFMLKLMGASCARGVLRQYSGRVPLKAFLVVVFLHLITDARRKLMRTATYLGKSMPEDLCQPEQPGQALLAEYGETLELALQQLSSGDRLVVELRYYHGHSMTAMAQMLGISISTISRRLEHCLQRLREAFARDAVTQEVPGMHEESVDDALRPMQKKATMSVVVDEQQVEFN